MSLKAEKGLKQPNRKQCKAQTKAGGVCRRRRGARVVLLRRWSGTGMLVHSGCLCTYCPMVNTLTTSTSGEVVRGRAWAANPRARSSTLD
jgi:hypothetical protein